MPASQGLRLRQTPSNQTFWVLEFELRPLCMLEKTLPTELHTSPALDQALNVLHAVK